MRCINMRKKRKEKKKVLPVLDPDKLYLELAFLMMFSWI